MIIQVTKDELKELIRLSIIAAMKENQSSSIDEGSKESLLKIEEVSEILKVSKVTVHKWKKAGKIPFHRISNRIFFKKNEILESLKKISSTKSLGGGKR